MAEANFDQSVFNSGEKAKPAELETLARELHGLLTELSFARTENDFSLTKAAKNKITDWCDKTTNVQEVIERLAKSFCGEAIEMIRLFPQLDKNHFVDSILEKVGTDFGSEVLDLLDSPDFHDFIKEKLHTLVSTEWLDKLQGLDADFLKTLTTSSEFNLVSGQMGLNVVDQIITHVDAFSTECHPEIVRAFVAEGYENQVYAHLDKFQLNNADDMRSDLHPTTVGMPSRPFDLVHVMHSMRSFANLDRKELINLALEKEWTLESLVPFISDLEGEDVLQLLGRASEKGLLDLTNYLLKYDFKAILMIAENGFDVRIGGENKAEVRQALLGAAKMFAETGCPKMLSEAVQVAQLMIKGGKVDRSSILPARAENIVPYKSFDLGHSVANFYLRDAFYKEYVLVIEESLEPKTRLLMQRPKNENDSRSNLEKKFDIYEGNGELTREPQEFRSMIDRVELAQLNGFRDKDIEPFFDSTRQYILYAVAGEVESILPEYDKKHEFAINVDRLLKDGNVEEIQKFLMRSIMVLAKHDNTYSYRGGEPWVKVAELAMNMWSKNPNERALLDVAIDMEHNGGRIFDKEDHGRIYNTDPVLRKGDSSLLEFKKHNIFARLLEYCQANDLISKEEIDEYEEMQQRALALLDKAHDKFAIKAALYD